MEVPFDDPSYRTEGRCKTATPDSRFLRLLGRRQATALTVGLTLRAKLIPLAHCKLTPWSFSGGAGSTIQ
jgi:hypothetical protein